MSVFSVMFHWKWSNLLHTLLFPFSFLFSLFPTFFFVFLLHLHLQVMFVCVMAVCSQSRTRRQKYTHTHTYTNRMSLRGLKKSHWVAYFICWFTSQTDGIRVIDMCNRDLLCYAKAKAEKKKSKSLLINLTYKCLFCLCVETLLCIVQEKINGD